jgi:putative sterol carrier protein
MTLDQITSEMTTRVSARGGIKGKTIKFHFGDDGVVRVLGASEPATVDNEDGPADCTVKVSMADFVKIRVEGDMGLAMQLGTVLG